MLFCIIFALLSLHILVASENMKTAALFMSPDGSMQNQKAQWFVGFVASELLVNCKEVNLRNLKKTGKVSSIIEGLRIRFKCK